MSQLSKEFLIIGHRGAAGEYIENSMQGFRHALTLPIDAIELDIRQHGSELWIIHDQNLLRLTGTEERFAEQTDLSHLRLRNGEPLSPLRDLLNLAWGKMPLNIEIKSIDSAHFLLDLLAQFPALPEPGSYPWILISSFNHRVLLELKQLGCRWPLAPITSGLPIETAQLIKLLKPWSWHFNQDYIDIELIQELHQQSIKTLVFTVNDAKHAQHLRDQGVAGIFTDQPSAMLASLRS